MGKPLTMQTNSNTHVALLTLACLKLTSSQKAATVQLTKPVWEWGKGNLSFNNSGLRTCHPTGKPPLWDAAEAPSLLAAAPAFAHVQQVTKPDHCSTNLTSNLPQVKNDLHSIVIFLYSSMGEPCRKWNGPKVQRQMPNLQNAVVCVGPPSSSAPSLLHWLWVGRWGTEIILRH